MADMLHQLLAGKIHIKLGLHNILHEIVMRISSVKSVLWLVKWSGI